ncbi:hypothetical protein C8Q78DRAFT_1078911 [Trametes maxima]|nr:hypothetical protein C8Q78DRAFT_1078911 [Trametes maxima]
MPGRGAAQTASPAMQTVPMTPPGLPSVPAGPNGLHSPSSPPTQLRGDLWANWETQPEGALLNRSQCEGQIAVRAETLLPVSQGAWEGLMEPDISHRPASVEHHNELERATGQNPSGRPAEEGMYLDQGGDAPTGTVHNAMQPAQGAPRDSSQTGTAHIHPGPTNDALSRGEPGGEPAMQNKGKGRGSPGPPTPTPTPAWQAPMEDDKPYEMSELHTPEPKPSGYTVIGDQWNSTPHLEGAIAKTVLDSECTWDDFVTDGIGRDGRPLLDDILAPSNPHRMTFLPIPEEGIEDHAFNDPEQLLRGMSAACIGEIWHFNEGTTILVQVYNLVSPHEGLAGRIVDQLTVATMSITEETDFRIIAPEPTMLPNGERGDMANVFTITNLSPSGAALMTEQRVWASRLIVFMAHRREIVIPGLVCTAMGFGKVEHDEILQAVQAAFHGPEILPMTMRLIQQNPALNQTPMRDVLRATIGELSIETYHLHDGRTFVAIYCDSPTGSVAEWRRWRNTILRVPFRTRLNGTGYALRPATCEGCHSAAHPTEACPLAKLAGWPGPQPTVRRPPTFVRGPGPEEAGTSNNTTRHPQRDHRQPRNAEGFHDYDDRDNDDTFDQGRRGNGKKRGARGRKDKGDEYNDRY